MGELFSMTPSPDAYFLTLLRSNAILRNGELSKVVFISRPGRRSFDEDAVPAVPPIHFPGCLKI